MGLCSEVADGGGNLEDHPALSSRYVCRKAPFQRANCPGKFVSDPLNLFHSAQTKPCLGHCITRGLGLRRQATISACAAQCFCAHGTGAWNSKARAGLKRLLRGFSPCRGAASYLSAHGPWNFAIPLPLCRGTGDFHESQRRRICAHEIGNPGLLEVAISDRRPGQVGKDRSKDLLKQGLPC